MKTKNLFFTAMLLIFGGVAFSQDVITQKNGESIEVKIVELSDDMVKFYYLDDPNHIVVSMNRSLIREINFEYGRKEEETQPGLDQSYYVDDNRNNVMVNFSAIATNSAILAYERSLSPSSSLGLGIKFHGVGVNSGYSEDRSGFGFEVNYKLKPGAMLKKDQYRPNHLLQGFYMRPDLGYTTLDQNTNTNWFGTTTSNENYSYFYGGFDLGYQWVFNNKLSLDIYSGLNFYGGDYSYQDGGESPFDRNNISDGNMTGYNNVAERYGVQLGLLFN